MFVVVLVLPLSKGSKCCLFSLLNRSESKWQVLNKLRESLFEGKNKIERLNYHLLLLWAQSFRYGGGRSSGGRVGCPLKKLVVQSSIFKMKYPWADTEPQIAPNGCTRGCECVCLSSWWAQWHFMEKLPCISVWMHMWIGECWFVLLKRYECSRD